MSGKNLGKEYEDLITDLLRSVCAMIGGFVKGVGRGIKKLSRKKERYVFLLALLITAIAYLFRSRIMSINGPPMLLRSLYWLFLLCPLFVLYGLGSGTNKTNTKYEEIFREIGFKDKTGKYPVFINLFNNGKKEVLLFGTVIPIQEWKSALNRLESGFDRNILKIENGDRKRIVKITTVPIDCVIPSILSWNDAFIDPKDGEMVVGQGALQTISFNLNRVPHVLIAGETGSGKSVILRCCLYQLLRKNARVFMFDFKGGVEFGKDYEQYGEVVVDRTRALAILDMLVNENSYRLSIFRDLRVKNLPEYNQKTGQNLCRIGVFCDEIGEMMDKKGVAKAEKELLEKIEGRVSTLARMSRATGINLFLGVQRPDANILTGQIKNNIPARISGRFADKTASEIVLGSTAAVDLPDIKGRFLYKVGNEILEFQSYFFKDEEVFANADFIVSQGEMLTEVPAYENLQKPEKKISNETAYKEKQVELTEDAESWLREMDDFLLNDLE